jgi:hypothetical protein
MRARRATPGVVGLGSIHVQAQRIAGVRALACLAVFVSACAKPYNPFKIPDSELRGRVRTIAIAPLLANANLVDREYARAQIEPLVGERLRAGGFQVVASAEMERLWRRAADDVGGIFDPVSGKMNKERFEAVQVAVYRDLRTERGTDAVLYVSISAVDLYLTGRKVDYCGTQGDEVYWPGPAIGLTDRTTVVYALCLNVDLEDMERRSIYSIRHGLETVETYFLQTRAVRPMDQRLRNRERLVQAVEATLGPLANAER